MSRTKWEPEAPPKAWKLQMLDAAQRLDDLRLPPGHRLELLKGDRTGRHGIASTINGGYAFPGAMERLLTSRLSTIIEGIEMSIKRSDLDAGRVDFKGIATRRRIAPTHPGRILRDEFLEPMGVSVAALANAVKVPRARLTDIVLGRRAIGADTALRLARYFGTTPELWINLQARYDLELFRFVRPYDLTTSCIAIRYALHYCP